MTPPEGLIEALARILADAWGGEGVGVSGMERLSGGASREIWAFEASRGSGGAGPLPLVVLRDIERGPGAWNWVDEGALLRAAEEAGVPVPSVVAEGEIEGRRALVLERVAGESIPRRILRDAAYASGRPLLAEQCGQALARIHAIAPSRVPGLATQDPLPTWRHSLDALGEPHPTFELALRWLEAHQPPPTARQVVVHGDFRNGNLMVGPDGLRAVLDWELAHLGDPLEDLAWLCVRAWRFGSVPPVGGFGEREVLYAAYEAAGGTPVDREAARWWEVLSTLKWGVICGIQAATHLSAATRSVELAAIGRRVCEQEWDLLELLEVPVPPPEPSSSPDFELDSRAPRSDLYGVPSAAQLVEAVREYLEGDVSAATAGQVRFHARVAANALAIVERELALGDSASAAHRRALASLGVSDEAELAAAVRDGVFERRVDELGAVLRETVSARLRVASPRRVAESRP
ncbi:MAG: phosphotransferase family protein [Acidimicrobiales bacterium]